MLEIEIERKTSHVVQLTPFENHFDEFKVNKDMSQ